ncbi:MAG: peptide chain release factor N(5)-glutamine methyltransferase [Candidatus Sungbacteria bacterium]|nr:peptide chain release factor N(5)-glutamine methyltransferase [Candidatus Sungbacteria bacterium]
MNRYRGFGRFKKSIQLLIRDKYKGDKTRLVPEDISRLKKGEPVDYVIGWIPFLDTDIDLSKKPLIPRSETEFWAGQVIKEIEALRGRDAKFMSLDIFAGSGCIGTAVLKYFPKARIDFADIDPEMIKQIKINIKKNGVQKRARVLRSDGFKNIKNKYDFIFANPPYVSSPEMKKLAKSVKDFEPMNALFGGKDGLEIIRQFISGSRNFLKAGGAVYMELGSTQKKAIEKIAEKENGQDINFFRDQYGRWRWMRLLTK